MSFLEKKKKKDLRKYVFQAVKFLKPQAFVAANGGEKDNFIYLNVF